MSAPSRSVAWSIPRPSQASRLFNSPRFKMEPLNKAIQAVLMGLGIQARKQKARPAIARLVGGQAGLPCLSPPSCRFVWLGHALHTSRPAPGLKSDAHTHTPAPGGVGGGGALTNRGSGVVDGLQLTGNIVNGLIVFLPGVVTRREVWLSKVRGEVQSANKMRQAGFSFLRLFDRLLYPLKKFLKICAGRRPTRRVI